MTLLLFFVIMIKGEIMNNKDKNNCINYIEVGYEVTIGVFFAILTISAVIFLIALIITTVFGINI